MSLGTRQGLHVALAALVSVAIVRYGLPGWRVLREPDEVLFFVALVPSIIIVLGAHLLPQVLRRSRLMAISIALPAMLTILALSIAQGDRAPGGPMTCLGLHLGGYALVLGSSWLLDQQRTEVAQAERRAN